MLVECKNKEEVLYNFYIRKKVFIEEQNVGYEDEYDLKEMNGKMYLYEVDGVYTSCARVLYDSASSAHIGRVATLSEYRGLHYSFDMMNLIEKELKEEGIKEINIDAQLSAIGFYEKLGYVAYGEVFLDANIKHKHMKKII